MGKFYAKALMIFVCLLAGGLAFADDYSLIPKSAISGFNNESLTSKSPAQCMAACDSRSWCKSIDYFTAKSSCDLSDKSALAVGGLKFNYPDDPYKHYAKVDGTGFAQIPNAAISGNNTEQLTGASAGQCKSACNSRSWCKSFDYHKGRSKCDLSNRSAADVGGLKSDYAGNPYDHYSKATDRSAPAVETPAARPPEIVSLRSVNFPDRYVKHQGGNLVIAQATTPETKARATFRRVPGLAGAGTVSFQSLDKPGYYLRHSNFQVTLQKNDGSSLFYQDASFTEKARNDLNSSRLARSYEAVNFPGYYIRHQNYALMLHKYDPMQRTFNADSSFELHPGLVKTAKTAMATGAAQNILSQIAFAGFSAPKEGQTLNGLYTSGANTIGGGHIQGIAKIAGSDSYVLGVSRTSSETRTTDFVVLWSTALGNLQFYPFNHVPGYLGGVSSALDIVVVGVGGSTGGANFFHWTGSTLVEKPGISPGCGNQDPSLAWHEIDQRFYLFACGIFMRSRHPGPDLANHPCANSNESPCWESIGSTSVIGRPHAFGGESLVYDRCTNALFHFTTKCDGEEESSPSCNEPTLEIRKIAITRDTSGKPTKAKVADGRKKNPYEVALDDANNVAEGPSFRWGGTVFADSEGRLLATGSKKFLDPMGSMLKSWYPTTWESEASGFQCNK